MGYTKGYKGFKKIDSKTGECRNFEFKEGETYEISGELKLCENGFHFCKDLALTFEHYNLSESTVYAEVEAVGDVEYEQPTKHKACTSKIKIVRFLSDAEIDEIIDGNQNSGYGNSGNWNSGNWNSGNGNSGSWNSGNCNSGYRNSGNGNSGNCNSGSWNSGNGNSGNGNSGSWNASNDNNGYFNTKEVKSIKVFNKKCKKDVWNNADKPNFLYFDIDPDLGYKGSFQKSFESATKEDVELLKYLPNFDADVFFEISGIRVD